MKIKYFIKPVVSILVFLTVQFLIYGLTYFNLNISIATALLLSNAVTILIFWLYRYFSIRESFTSDKLTARGATYAFLGSFAGIFALDLISELISLPDLLEEEFLIISSSVQGVLAIALLGPLCEEIIFREIIIRNLLSSGAKPIVAIISSALAFGIIHGNPAQIPFAIAMGLIFALIYWKTNSILLTSIIHIVNNGIAVLQMRLLGNDFHAYDYISMTTEIILIVVLSAISITLLFKFSKLSNLHS